jgi:uncharacterized Zn finger protein
VFLPVFSASGVSGGPPPSGPREAVVRGGRSGRSGQGSHGLTEALRLAPGISVRAASALVPRHRLDRETWTAPGRVFLAMVWVLTSRRHEPLDFSGPGGPIRWTLVGSAPTLSVRACADAGPVCVGRGSERVASKKAQNGTEARKAAEAQTPPAVPEPSRSASPKPLPKPKPKLGTTPGSLQPLPPVPVEPRPIGGSAVPKPPAYTKPVLGSAARPQFRPGQAALPMHPRRVRGGLKLASSDATYPLSWAAQRWIRLIEQAASGPAMVEGLNYARGAQTKSLSVDRGQALAVIQGRQYRAYDTLLRVPAFDESKWEDVLSAMTDQAFYAAKLLAGELPANIEDLFAPLSLRLFPLEPADVEVSCNCRQLNAGASSLSLGGLRSVAGEAPAEVVPPPSDEGGWCKHVVCAAYLLADRFASDPFLMFTLRGLPPAELRESLRERRSAPAGTTSLLPIYSPRVPGAGEMPAVSLDAGVDRFWETPRGLEDLDLPIERPAVAHPLLRRLGPSPFAQAQFPLLGLLASCYETFTEDALADGAGDPADTADDADGHGDGGGDDESDL